MLVEWSHSWTLCTIATTRRLLGSCTFDECTRHDAELWWEFIMLSPCCRGGLMFTVARCYHKAEVHSWLKHVGNVFSFSSFLSFAPEMRPQSWGSGGRTPQTQSSLVAGVWGPAWPITWPRAAWRMWCCWRSPSWRLDPPGTLYVWQSSRFLRQGEGGEWAKMGEMHLSTWDPTGLGPPACAQTRCLP